VFLSLVTAYVPCSPVLVTLMMGAVRFSETSVLKRTTPRHIPEDGILHSHRRENLKSYIYYACFLFVKENYSDIMHQLNQIWGRSILL
jgi:hypothetical protein